MPRKELIYISQERMYELFITEKLTSVQISKRYNCSTTTISRILEKYGIKKRNTPREEDLRRMYYVEKMTIVSIARFYNCTPESINYHLKEMCILKRPNVKTMRPEKEVLLSLQTNHSIAKIAIMYDVTDQCIYKWIAFYAKPKQRYITVQSQYKQQEKENQGIQKSLCDCPNCIGETVSVTAVMCNSGGCYERMTKIGTLKYKTSDTFGVQFGGYVESFRNADLQILNGIILERVEG